MKSFLDTFTHTNPDIHGAGCVKEFLIPDIIDLTPNFIGLKTGKKYLNGLLCGTHAEWDENSLLELLSKVITADPFNRTQQKEILSNFISELKELRKKNHLDYIIILDKKLSLIPFEHRKE